MAAGMSYGGDAKNNAVNITAGTVESNAIAGGYATEGTNQTVSGNKAAIHGGTVGASSPTALVGGFAGSLTSTTAGSLTVTDNGAVLTGGTLTGGVVGGAGIGSGTTVTNNHALVSGGTFTGGSNSYTGSFIPGAIIGGAAYNGASATGNTVQITGGTISGYVMGGLGSLASGSIAASTASDNTVELSGTSSTLNLSQARIYGSALYSTGSINTTDAGGNNTLKLATQGVKALNIHNFQNIIVDFSKLSATPMLTLTMGQTLLGGATFTKTGELADTDIGATGLVYPVLQNTNGITGLSAASETWQATGNYNYRFAADSASTTINAEIYKQGSNTSSVDAEVTGDVYGGRAMVGTNNSDGNTLNVNAQVNGNAYGGYSNGGEAKNNNVTITSTTVTGDVYGGYSNSNGATTGNVVTLKNATIGGNVFDGNNSTYTGNQLYISGVNSVGKTVGNFETIVLAADTAWNPGSTVLTANKFTNIGSLDISQAANVQAATAEGTMTLLASKTDNDFSTLSLKYYDGKSANLTAENSSQVVKSENSGDVDLGNGATYGKTTTHTVSLDTANNNKNVLYTVSSAGTISLAGWNGTEAAVTGITGTNIPVSTGSFTVPAAAEQVILTSDTANFFGEVTGERAYTSGAFSSKADNGVALSGTKYGGVKKSDDGKVLTYYAETTSIDAINLAAWDGKTTSAVTDGWKAADTITVSTDGMANLPSATTDILTKNTSFDFTNANVTGSNAYTDSKAFTESEKGAQAGSVTLTGTQSGGVRVKEDKSAIEYVAESRKVTGIALGETAFAKDTTVLTQTGASYNYASAQLDSSNFAATFNNPLEVTAGESMTLLTANDTLPELVTTQSTQTTTYTNATLAAASGITVDGQILGSLGQSGSSITYTTAANNATSLTFGDVEWKDTGAILDHSTTLSNVSFEGAAVNTSNIKFTNLDAQEADKTTVLVSNFGSTVGEITGTEYQVGSGLRGKGKASLEDGNLIFTTETRSHVNTHTWNAILAAGHQNAKDSGTFEYGAFFEYGRGNYATHNGAERGDGSMHYTGGGLLSKWQAPTGLYVEGSVRGGNVRDNARNVMRDAAGNPSSYNTSAGYWGFHLGVGKEIAVGEDKTVDVYGKYFFNRRNGVSFNAAGNHYDLDAVNSKVFRVGSRYTLQREKWNFYGGLAYEYEFGGEATGRVDGADIRSADIGGGSVFGELGAKLVPGESPWGLDLFVNGFAGKKRGVSGGVSVAYMF